MRPVAMILAVALPFAAVSLLWIDEPLRPIALRGASDFWHVVSLVGTSGWMLGGSLLAGLAFAFLGQKLRRNAAFFIFGAVALSGIAVQVLKAIIGRARPTQYDLVGAFDFQPFTFSRDYASMPSGHATTGFALAVAVAIVQPALRAPAAVFAVLISWSRLPEGMHYLSDITLGAALGSITAIALAGFLNRRGAAYRFR